VRGIKERRQEEFRIINNSVYIIERRQGAYIVGESAHEKTNTKKIKIKKRRKDLRFYLPGVCRSIALRRPATLLRLLACAALGI
jgi:hypothetical protein